MNAGLAHTIDSLFGPASEKIDVNAFIESEKILYQDTLSNQPSFSTIAEECRFYNFLFFARFHTLIMSTAFRTFAILYIICGTTQRYLQPS